MALQRDKVPLEVIQELKEEAEQSARQVGVAAFLRLVLDERVPCVDVRSPAEYAKGHIPGAANSPLLLDDERHQVGITYSRQGKVSWRPCLQPPRVVLPGEPRPAD